MAGVPSPADAKSPELAGLLQPRLAGRKSSELAGLPQPGRRGENHRNWLGCRNRARRGENHGIGWVTAAASGGRAVRQCPYVDSPTGRPRRPSGAVRLREGRACVPCPLDSPVVVRRPLPVGRGVSGPSTGWLPAAGRPGAGSAGTDSSERAGWAASLPFACRGWSLVVLPESRQPCATWSG